MKKIAKYLKSMKFPVVEDKKMKNTHTNEISTREKFWQKDYKHLGFPTGINKFQADIKKGVLIFI